MNKTALLSALAAAALLAGCRTTQTTHARRGALSGGQTASASQPARSRARAAAKTAPAPTYAKPASGTVAETPLVPENPQPAAVRTQPAATWTQPAAVQAQPVAAQARPIAHAVPDVPMWTTPPAAAEPAPAPVSAPVAAPAATTPETTVYETYVVKRGDVAGRIANSHGMTLKEFMEANGMTLEQAGKLRENQKVNVWKNGQPLAAGPAASPAQTAASGDPDVYVVQAGDTLLGISAKTGVPMATLMANNGIDNPNAIRAGRTLVLKKKAEAAPVKTVAEPVKTVEPAKTAEPVKTVETVRTVEPAEEPVKQAAKPVKQTVKTGKQTSKTGKQTSKPVEPAVEPAQASAEPVPPPPQDASVPLDEVKVAGTDLSVADILDGASLSDAREKAETKKEEAVRQAGKAVETAAEAADDAPAGFKYYVVKEGETLYHLGARYKVPFKTLRELNHLPSGASKLEPGTRLLIPDTAAAVGP